jgi:hypothetical protein
MGSGTTGSAAPQEAGTPWIPTREGELFLDDRGEQRTLRLTWHREVDLVVLSLWREGRCTGTFRLRVTEVPALIDALRSGLEGDIPPSSDV